MANANLSILDLRPYGIDGSLTKDSDVSKLHIMNIRPVTLDVPNNAIVMDNVPYKLLYLLGKGTFGTTYLTISPDNTYSACKVIKYVPKHESYDKWRNNILMECIIQIIIVNVSKAQPNGPFAPVLYEIGLNESAREIIVRSETMDGTFLNEMRKTNPFTSDIFISEGLLQLCDMLSFLKDQIQFNHRDLKPDNIMFQRIHENPYMQFKLIDFGFACLTWNGLNLTCDGYFSRQRPCMKPYRDLAQMIYFLCKHTTLETTNPRLFHLLRTLIGRVYVTNNNSISQINNMYAKIPEWVYTYNYLNRNNLIFPDIDYNVLKTLMLDFQHMIQQRLASAPPTESAPPFEGASPFEGAPSPSDLPLPAWDIHNAVGAYPILAHEAAASAVNMYPSRTSHTSRKSRKSRKSRQSRKSRKSLRRRRARHHKRRMRITPLDI